MTSLIVSLVNSRGRQKGGDYGVDWSSVITLQCVAQAVVGRGSDKEKL